MAEQLFQIGIKAIIQNEQKQVLLVNFQKDDGSMHMWDLPGGRMDPGEGFVDTLRRELQEEIGIDYSDEPMFMTAVLSNITIPVDGKDIPLVLMAYRVRLSAGMDPTAAEQDMVLQWTEPRRASQLLAEKFPAEFCAAVAAL